MIIAQYCYCRRLAFLKPSNTQCSILKNIRLLGPKFGSLSWIEDKIDWTTGYLFRKNFCKKHKQVKHFARLDAVERLDRQDFYLGKKKYSKPALPSMLNKSWRNHQMATKKPEFSRNFGNCQSSWIILVEFGRYQHLPSWELITALLAPSHLH